MNRALTCGGFGLLILAGCIPSGPRDPDPLAWKVEADDGNELQAWFDTNLPLMPEETARELAVCFSNIRSLSYAGPNASPVAKANHLAHQLNGRTVRDLLIEGNEMGVRTLEREVDANADMLLRMVNATDGTEPRVEAMIKRQRDRLDALKERLAKAHAHLMELHAGAGAP